MKPNGLKIAALAALLLLGAGRAARAAQLTLAPESGLWLTGDSTLHVFHSTATELRGSGKMDVQKPFPSGAIESFEFAVAVKGLKSGKAGLDENMWKALKADKNPEIVFRLSQLASEPGADGGFLLKAQGTLSVAGQEKPVVLGAKGRSVNGRFLIEGEQALLMTDFGVKPPAMMLGAIKTKNEVTIHYRIFLGVGEDKQEAKP